MAEVAPGAARSEYEGLESFFPDDAAREAYRTGLLERTAPQADFLAARLGPTQPRLLEIACGNGRLLIELARRGRLGRGVGLDLASSRIAFAQSWASDLGLEGLRFATADVLEHEPEPASLDGVVCITGAFAYFDPVRSGADRALLDRWHRALVPGGLLALELYPHPELLPLLAAADGPLRVWRELPPEDPWRFYLSEMTFEDGVLGHVKTFVHRTTGEVDTGRHERLRLYRAEEISGLLATAGYTAVSLHEGWSEEPYGGGGQLVAVARRPAD